MKPTREDDIINSLRNKSRRMPETCYYPKCNDKAIRSHIIQAGGPLSNIESKGHVIQLIFNSLKRCYQFEKVGIRDSKGDVLTYRGFCNKCDSKLFQPIERKNVDLYLYKNQLLCSYRGFLSELYKQESNLKWYTLIDESNVLSQRKKDLYKEKKWLFTVLVNNTKYFKLELENEIYKPNNILNKIRNIVGLSKPTFTFVTRILPKLQFCTSTYYALPVKIEVREDEVFLRSKFHHFKPTTFPVFISVIPEEDKTVLIIGIYNKSNAETIEHFELIKKYGELELLKYISDTFIKRIETWVMSTQLYTKFESKGVDKEIINNIHRYLPAEKKKAEIHFNIFDHI